MAERDDIYADPIAAPGPFRFDSNVARVFPDMIKRSVPGYTTVVSMTGLMAGRYAVPGSNLYDLGCSLGASTLAMRQNLRCGDCRIIGVDNAADMLDRCRTVVESDVHDTPVELVNADIEAVPIERASVVVLNYTLQFVPPARRADVLRRIHDGLLPGGILILSEKVVFEDAALNQLNIDLHHEFKRAHGYSDLEIAQKRAAIEDVLVPETLTAHRQRLRDVGFTSCDVWFQCFNFASLIALR